jgi:hypothetical protein
MYYLQRNFIVWASLVLASAMSFSTMTQASDVYFSEYSEATVWYNRYVEIHNQSGATIDLKDYAILYCLNSCENSGLYDEEISFGGMTTAANRYIEDGGTYTIRHNRNTGTQKPAQAIIDAATTNGRATSLLVISGNDPLALVKRKDTYSSVNETWKTGTTTYTVKDVIGTPKTNTNAFGAVCGSNNLVDVVLIKKEQRTGRTSWTNSRGTGANATEKAENCDWIVKTVNYRGNLGTHNPGDITDPVITLSGDQIVEIALNGSYSDAGATASDDTDGTITGNIVTVGNTINTSVAGTYAVTYDVEDAVGNSATQVVRTVIVSPWNFDSVAHGWIAANGATSATGTSARYNLGAITLTVPTTKGYGGSATNNTPDFRIASGANINPKAGKYVAVTMKNKSPNAKLALGAFTGDQELSSCFTD